MVIRTGPGQEFDAALRGDVLAFQADRIGIQARTGWSVLVIGHASVVHEIDRLVDLVAVEYRPRVSGRERHVIEVAGERARRRCRDGRDHRRAGRPWWGGVARMIVDAVTLREEGRP